MAQNNYQELLLNAVRKENIPITIFLVSGFQIRGTVRAYDNYVIIIESEGKQQMLYKHAISTIIPLKAVEKLNSGDC
jgi:host factor-I protein